MRAATKGNILRIAIPVLRILPSLSALYAFTYLYHYRAKPFIVYAPPFQKEFYSPIVRFVWSALALVPFILLRSRVAFRIYSTLLFACLAFMSYDYFVPFRYVSLSFHGQILDSGGGFSSSGNKDSIDYLISYPTFPPNEDSFLCALVYITPLILAFVYRRYYVLWAHERPLE